MKTESQHIEDLKIAVLAKFARTLDSPTDYDTLSLDIADITNETVSPSTLKRLFGYDKHSTSPRPSTLSTLSRYVGYVGWSNFCEQNGSADTPKFQKPGLLIHNPFILLSLFVVVCVVILLLVVLPANKQGLNSVAQSSTGYQLESTEPSVLSVDEVRKKWTTLSIHKCDSIRRYRDQMDIDKYASIVDEFYFDYVFEQMKHGVAEDIGSIESLSEYDIIEANGDIFASCQNLCVELIREISAEQLENQYNQAE